MSKIIQLLRFKEIVFNGKSYNKSQIEDKFKQLASKLDIKQVSSPFIFLIARNNLATLISFLALRELNQVCVFIDPLLGQIEYDEYIDLLQPWCVIDHKSVMDEDVVESDIEFLEYQTKRAIDEEILEDACAIMFSSGEDGRMKPVVISEDNILRNIEGILTGDINDDSRSTCAILPFFHIFGLVNGLIIPLITGGRVLIVDISDISKVTKIVEEIKNHKITNIYTIPLLYFLFTRVKDIDYYLSEVITLYSGGYKLTRDIYESFYRKTQKKIHEGYGLTESTGLSIGHWVLKEPDPENIGNVVTMVNKLKIVDNTGKEVPIGGTGEILLKGANITKGFYADKIATTKYITDGWLHTGDLGHIDMNDYVYFDGLLKRMYNIGGKNIYPAEVERLLMRNSNVKKATILGTPNGIFGDKLSVTIELYDNNVEEQKRLQDWSLLNVTQFKIPKQWNFD